MLSKHHNVGSADVSNCICFKLYLVHIEIFFLSLRAACVLTRLLDQPLLILRHRLFMFYIHEFDSAGIAGVVAFLCVSPPQAGAASGNFYSLAPPQTDPKVSCPYPPNFSRPSPKRASSSFKDSSAQGKQLSSAFPCGANTLSSALLSHGTRTDMGADKGRVEPYEICVTA